MAWAPGDPARPHHGRAGRPVSTMSRAPGQASPRGCRGVETVPRGAAPRGSPVDTVRQLLASINRRTAVGRRNYALVLVLARLGLRASEVVHLELDDIDWDAGQLSVRSKGGYQTALALPSD